MQGRSVVLIRVIDVEPFFPERASEVHCIHRLIVVHGTEVQVRPSQGYCSEDDDRERKQIPRPTARGLRLQSVAHVRCECPFLSDASAIPKGLCPPAQGCEERATLGTRRQRFTTPTGLRPFPLLSSHGAATL